MAEEDSKAVGGGPLSSTPGPFGVFLFNAQGPPDGIPLWQAESRVAVAQSKVGPRALFVGSFAGVMAGLSLLFLFGYVIADDLTRDGQAHVYQDPIYFSVASGISAFHVTSPLR